MVAGLEGVVVVGGLGAVGGGLASIGIPKDSIVEYETALKTDKFLLIVHATPENVEKAKQIIDAGKHSVYTVHIEPALVG